MPDTKLADLTALTTPSGDDLLYVVDDPAGTPADRKLALDNLFTRGTVTTSQPVIDASQTWNAGAVTFTGLKFNATEGANGSAAASLLMDLQVGGSSAFNVSKGGSLKLGRNASGTNVAASNVVIAGSQGTGTGAGGSIIVQVAPAGLSGTAQNALATALTIDSTKRVTVESTETSSSTTTGALVVKGGLGVNSLIYCLGLNAGPSNIANSGTSNYIGTIGSFFFKASADGVVELCGSGLTGSGFGRLQFGGTTSSFPALKRVSANLQVIAADNAGSAGLIVGNQALATNATDGFLYVPTCAGTPTGTPTAQTGTVPIVVDTTNNKLYFYSGAAWRDAGP